MWLTVAKIAIPAAGGFIAGLWLASSVATAQTAAIVDSTTATVVTMAGANRSQSEAISRLERQNQINAERYQAEQARQANEAARLSGLAERQERQISNLIERLRNDETVTEWADMPVPDAVVHSVFGE